MKLKGILKVQRILAMKNDLINSGGNSKNVCSTQFIIFDSEFTKIWFNINLDIYTDLDKVVLIAYEAKENGIYYEVESIDIEENGYLVKVESYMEDGLRSYIYWNRIVDRSRIKLIDGTVLYELV